MSLLQHTVHVYTKADFAIPGHVCAVAVWAVTEQ
jgi:hypothetical protein